MSVTKSDGGYENQGYDKSVSDIPTSEMAGESGGTKFTIRRILTVMCILVCELCERLTYYSVVAELVLYCTSVLKYNSNDAETINYVFQGVVYFIPLFGGYIADAYAGRYNTILGAGFIYVIGVVLLPASAVDYRSIFGMDDDGSGYDMTLEARRIFFMLSLVFIAVGTGGIKANVGPFGAQQVEDLGEGAVSIFFNWFYWFINVGAMIAHVGVAHILQNISWAWGFSVPLVSMILSLLVFISASSKYKRTPPGGSVLTTVFRVYRKGCGDFNRVRKKNGGPFDDFTVDGALSVVRVMPIFLLLIIFWAIYSQMSTTFFLQAERMNAKVGDGPIPIASLNAFNTVSILLLIPLVDRIIYPFFQRKGRPLTHLQRIGIGLIFAALSVIVSGVIEIYRKKDLVANGPVFQILGGDGFNASHMSVFVTVPEYALIGASEVFASITSLEFAFTQAPPSMRGVIMGINMMTSGLGSFVSEAIHRIVEAATEDDPWMPNDINDGKAEYFFFLLGGLMFVDFIIFLFVARWYTYLKPPSVDETDMPEKVAVNNGITADDGYTISYDENDRINTKM